jgi:hypothetical protein
MYAKKAPEVTHKLYLEVHILVINVPKRVLKREPHSKSPEPLEKVLDILSLPSRAVWFVDIKSS